ncbi:hypothetical protein P3S68_007307 [Capsicum galapagoense]
MRKSPFFVATNGSDALISSFPLIPNSDFNSTSLNSTFLFPSVSLSDGTFDFATVCFISALLLLSFLCLIFIFHLRFRSRQYPLLQHINSLWTVRLLLVFFAFLWAFNEVFRLHFIRRKYVLPFLPSLTLNQQANLCKVQVVLSLGLFEPGFLITLLFLVNVSIKIQNNPSDISALFVVWPICVPLLVLQILLVFFSPLQEHIPILCLVLLPFRPAEDLIHGAAVMVMFLAVALCVAIGEVTLVIKPIADAFAAGRSCTCRLNPGDALRHPNGNGGRVEERS